MEEIQMCRICLAENVRVYVVVSKKLHDLYEKLTDIPFVTEDSRPINACFICCAQLKKCYRFQKKCLEAEELFAQMMNKEYEPKPLNQDYLELFHGFIRTPIDTINIVDVDQTESIVVKEELQAVSERLDDIIEPKKEPDTNEDIESATKYNECLEIEYIPPRHIESDSEDDVPLMEVKIEIKEEVEESETEHRDEEKNCMPVAEKSTQEETNTAAETETDQIRRHIGEKSFKCDICPRTFNLKHNLKRHIRLHAGDKPYKCDICQRSFNAQHNLTAHRVVHTGVKPFKCEICQKSFTQKNNLNRHVRIHTGENPYKCDVCQRRFNTQSNFLKHNLVHSGVKPFKCDICQSSFSLQCHLRKHAQQHTAEKPFKCQICQRSFSYQNNLKCHTLIHTGEKPFKCNTCLKSFRHKNGLIKHSRTHTGEKPYKCDMCQRSFSQSGTLARHIEKKTCVKRMKRKGGEGQGELN